MQHDRAASMRQKCGQTSRCTQKLALPQSQHFKTASHNTAYQHQQDCWISSSSRRDQLNSWTVGWPVRQTFYPVTLYISPWFQSQQAHATRSDDCKEGEASAWLLLAECHAAARSFDEAQVCCRASTQISLLQVQEFGAQYVSCLLS